MQVGLEEVHPAMKELALIGITFQMPGGLENQSGRVGPLRMHYERVMGAVLHMSRALESVQL